MKKSKKRLNGKGKFLLIGKLVYLLVLILSIYLLTRIIKMNILPTKYLILVILVLVIVFLVIGLLIFKHGVKFFIKVFNIFLIFIVGLFMLFGLTYLNKTVNFLNNIKNKLYHIEEYYVVTLKENTYSSLNDLNGKEIGIYTDTTNGNYNNIVIDLLNDHSVLLKEYDNYEESYKALVNGKVDALLISGVLKTMAEDDNEEYNDKTKSVDKIEVKIEAQDIAKEVSVSKEPFNVYISGIDTYGKISTVSRSDVNMVFTINPDTNEVLMTSIPRDYYVTLYNKKGMLSSTKDKLTHAGMYGVETSVATIENLLGIDINYYVRVNFTTLKKLVNAIGGIEINSPSSFTSKVNKNCKFKKGKNKVKGACALAFARERYAFSEGDVQRVKNQQEVMRAIIDKAMTSKTIVSKYGKILQSFGNSFETNMPDDKIYELIKLQLADMPHWTLTGQNLTGYDAYDKTYSLGKMEVYVMVPNDETITSAKKAIKKVYNAKSVETLTK